jgi:hypothetical protein
MMNLATQNNGLVGRNLSNKNYLFIGRCAYINEILRLESNLNTQILESTSIRGIDDPVCAAYISN